MFNWVSNAPLQTPYSKPLRDLRSIYQHKVYLRENHSISHDGGHYDISQIRTHHLKID